jgi:D-xylose transport system permease protein
MPTATAPQRSKPCEREAKNPDPALGGEFDVGPSANEGAVVSGVATEEAAPAAPAERVRSSAREFFRRVGQGEFPALRVILGIAVIWTIFQLANDRFLTAVNLSNLVLQIAGVATISIGVVLVLLLGEIDLSVGAVSGLAASVMAVLSVQEGWSPELAIVAGLAVGTVIGLFTGFMVTTFGIPSFVVTLAGLIGWQGVQLAVLGETGTINLPDNVITDLTGTFFEPGVGWAIAVAVIAAYAASVLTTRARRVRAGLEAGPLAVSVGKVAIVAAAIIAAVAILNEDRGVPLAAVIMIGLMAIFSFITERTRYGRHIYAVGGNAEAARRAGIRINRVRMTVFMLASTLAAAGGILLASRLLAVNQSSGSSDLLLLAIAGPVIAGTSLFGGRGFVWSALLGALVIGSISNGIDLVGLESDIRFMITGGVLLLAVTIDALTRLRRQTTGAG